MKFEDKNFFAAYVRQSKIPPTSEIGEFFRWLERAYSAGSGGYGYGYFSANDYFRNVPGWPKPDYSSQAWGHVQVWPSNSVTPGQFVAFLLHALREKNPNAQILEIIEPEPEDAAYVREYFLEQEVRKWKTWIGDHVDKGVDRPPSKSRRWKNLELRILVDATGFSHQFRESPDDPFKPLTSAVLSRWRRTPGFLREIPERAHALVQLLIDEERLVGRSSLDGMSPSVFLFARKLAANPDSRAMVQLANGSTDVFSNEPLRWTANEVDGFIELAPTWRECPLPKAHSINSDGMESFLFTDSGVFPAGNSERLLTQMRSGRVRIPTAAFQSKNALVWLSEFVTSLPPSLARICSHETARPAVEIETRESAPNRKTLVLRGLGLLSDGRKATTLLESSWKLDTVPGERGTGKSPWILPDISELGIAQDAIIDLGGKWNAPSRQWETRMTKNFPEQFLAWLERYRGALEVRALGELSEFLADPIKARVRLEIESFDNDWFDIAASLEIADLELSPEEIKALLKARGKFVYLPGHGWRRLQLELDEADRSRLDSIGISPDEFDGQKQRVHALQLKEAAEAGTLPAEATRQIRERIASLRLDVPAEPPSGLLAKLRPYQIEGLRFLAYLSENHFGGLLADDMGLGKTVQTIAWMLRLRAETTPPRPSLVVCPKSVVGVWRAECQKFAPHLPVHILQNRGAGGFDEAVKSGSLVICNHAQLRLHENRLLKVEWQAAVVDEAQAIKNPASQTARTARNLPASHRLALTGTPIENRAMDVWSIMAFAMPGILGTQARFQREFGTGGAGFSNRRLAALLKPFFLRRTKTQVASDLPERVEEELVVELEPEQAKIYSAELKRARQALLSIQTAQQFDKQRFHILTSLLRLRQICCHPALAGHEPPKQLPAKVQALIDQLETLVEENEKVVVFSQWVEMLDILRGVLQEREWPTFLLTGGTENREQLVENFQNAPGSAIFLISLKAGGSGLNLTAANYVFLFDPWWNPAVEAQAIDRTHRIGQHKTVFAYRLLAKDTVEEKIRLLQNKKRLMADEITGAGGFSDSLSLDDFRFLLQSDQ